MSQNSQEFLTNLRPSRLVMGCPVHPFSCTVSNVLPSQFVIPGRVHRGQNEAKMTFTEFNESLFNMLRLRPAIYRSASKAQKSVIVKPQAPRHASKVRARNPVWFGAEHPTPQDITGFVSEITEINKVVLDALAL